MISDRVRADEALARKQVEERREQHRAELRERAARAILAALGLVCEDDRAFLARGLAEAALGHVARLHDPAKVQAILGKMSHGFAGELKAPRSDLRVAAERLFRSQREGA